MWIEVPVCLFIKTDDFTCDKVGIVPKSQYLTNDTSVKGNPVRLAPVTMTLRTDSVKKSYYHGEKLELNGLEVITEAGKLFSTDNMPYEVETDYNPNKSGSYNVKISVGKISSSFQVTRSKEATPVPADREKGNLYREWSYLL